MQRTLNVYGSDAVVREDWGVEKTPGEKRELICVTHTHVTQALFYKYRLNFYRSASNSS